MVFLYLEEEKWIQKKRKSLLQASETEPYDLVFRNSFVMVKICILFMEMIAPYSFPFYPNAIYALYKTLF